MELLNKEKPLHLGQNIRNIRLLRGMKQATFAHLMGIAQQNISKMENKKNISDEQLEQAAKMLNTTVEAIRKFNENAIINTNIFSKDQINHPIKEVIAYFKEEAQNYKMEIAKRDDLIEQLKASLDKHEKGNAPLQKSSEPANPDSSEKGMKAV